MKQQLTLLLRGGTSPFRKRFFGADQMDSQHVPALVSGHLLRCMMLADRVTPGAGWFERTGRGDSNYQDIQKSETIRADGVRHAHSTSPLAAIGKFPVFRTPR
jgi:hypothetical protein